MGLIVANVTVKNALQPELSHSFPATVDSAARFLTLPAAWREKFGELSLSREVTVELGDGSKKPGEVCGPVATRLETSLG